MTKSFKKYIAYISILVVVTVLAVYFVMKQDPKSVIDAILNCDVPWLLVSILGVVIYFLIEGIILMLLTRMYKRKYPYWFFYYSLRAEHKKSRLFHFYPLCPT